MKTTLKLFVAVASASCFSASALASTDCANATTQADMNQCAASAYKQEDAQLNKSYNDLLQKTEAKRKPEFKQVQVAWLKFRDLQCNYASAKSKGGSSYQLERTACLTQITKQRNENLTAMLQAVQ